MRCGSARRPDDVMPPMTAQRRRETSSCLSLYSTVAVLYSTAVAVARMSGAGINQRRDVGAVCVCMRVGESCEYTRMQSLCSERARLHFCLRLRARIHIYSFSYCSVQYSCQWRRDEKLVSCPVVPCRVFLYSRALHFLCAGDVLCKCTLYQNMHNCMCTIPI